MNTKDFVLHSNLQTKLSASSQMVKIMFLNVMLYLFFFFLKYSNVKYEQSYNMVQFLIMIVFMEILVIISMIIVIIVLLEKFEYFWFSLFLRIVIWSPAGQRHNVTMMEMNPSLHPVWEELVQIRGVNVRYGIFFYCNTQNNPDVGTSNSIY